MIWKQMVMHNRKQQKTLVIFWEEHSEVEFRKVDTWTVVRYDVIWRKSHFCLLQTVVLRVRIFFPRPPFGWWIIWGHFWSFYPDIQPSMMPTLWGKFMKFPSSHSWVFCIKTVNILKIYRRLAKKIFPLTHSHRLKILLASRIYHECRWFWVGQHCPKGQRVPLGGGIHL